MQARRCVWLILFMMMLAACAGGSGSSGFDVSSENAAIRQALDEEQCVTHKTLTICPAAEMPPPTPEATPTEIPLRTATPTSNVTPTAGAAPSATPMSIATPTSSPAPTGTPTPTPLPQVDIGLSPVSGIPCLQMDGSPSCSLMVPFAPQGFPSTAQFRVAVRMDSNGPWTVSAEPIAHGSPDMENFDGTVELTGIGASPNASISAQLAVLVFVHPPGVIPATVDELGDTGADYAFVTSELSVQAVASIP